MDVIIVFGSNINAAFFFYLEDIIKCKQTEQVDIDNKFYVKEIQFKMYVFYLLTFSILHFVGGEEGLCKE